ncbi:MAG TPA: asparaginase [Gemmatimonadales bacterium]|nr:asparaginase [Gemmatimonadales bacterium]
MQVELLRGTIVESRHKVHAAVVDADGKLVASGGDPDYITFWRSAAKPFQAMPIIADGAADHFGITEQELALTCASHSSEQSQVDLVRDFLKKIGCTERDLMCGPHTPLSDAVAKDYQTRGLRLTSVYSNCSGKHTGMLAQAKHNGWPTEGYVRPDHPVQKRCIAEVAKWTNVPEQQIGVAVDGCGVACFALPLRNMALAYAKLRASQSALRIREAMLRHPELIAGQGRPCTEMMQAHPNRVITKIGADGVYSALLVQEGLGVALKIEDGHGPASIVAIATILEELGLRPMPASLREKAMTNSRGETVGALRIRGGLTR